MSLRRQLNAQGIRHSNADSLTHARDVAERSRQRETAWIPETVNDSNPASVFKLRGDDLNLPKGIYFTGNGKDEKIVAGVDFEKHLAAANWERRFHYAPMKRGDKVSTVRRKSNGAAIGETIVNLAPWQMLWVNGELARWEKAGISTDDRKEMLFAFLDPLRKTVVSVFAEKTGRDVSGSYLHLDSNKIHPAIISSRTDSNNQLVGEKYLRTIGPWSVAQHRIKEIGAADSADNRLQQNLERFRERHGKDVIPLDIQLHSALDKKFDEQVASMGPDAMKRFEMAKKEYRGWKEKNRKEAVLRSPSSQNIAWDVIRLVSPLLPPQVQATPRLAHTAVQVIQVISAALDAIAPPTQPPPQQTQTQTREIDKVL